MASGVAPPENPLTAAAVTVASREARGPGREAPHAHPDEPSLSERHKWIVAEYLAGRPPSNKDIQKANRCSRATAARDLQALRNLGMLKSGHR